MGSKYTDDQKLQAFGLLATGLTPKEVSRKIGVPYPTVNKWKKEAATLEHKEDLVTIMDTDKAVVHEVAENIKNKLAELVEDGDEIVTGVLEKVDQLAALQTGLQESGINLLKRIDVLTDACESAGDVIALVEAVAKLQTAFFSKGANVNVLNVPGSGPVSSEGINAFKSMQRNA